MRYSNIISIKALLIICFIALVAILASHFSPQKQKEVSKEWETYTNYRYGYTIDYPQDWKVGREADNGDGKALHRDENNEILVYGTLVPSTFSTQDTPIEREVFVLNGGMEATQLKYKDEDNKIRYIVFFDNNEQQYTFFAKVSEDFFKENEHVLQEVAKSFNQIKSNPKLPECSLGRCPEYFIMEVDGNPDSTESVAIIPIGMTKGAGKVWIIRDGEVIYETSALAQIRVKENDTGNGFTLSYWKEWTNLDSPTIATVEYTYENGAFKEKNEVEVCDNYQDIEQFEKPIPVTWTAKFDGCLVGCWGAAFTRIPTDSKYPRFSAYVPDDGEKIDDKFLKENQTLKISGKFTGIDADHVSVFDRKCVPTIEIEKIEIIK